MPDRAYQVITTRTAEKELLELPPRISRPVERSIDRIQAFFQQGQLIIEPVTEAQARIAREAFQDFGRGSGHPAGLNFGDCFAYALAKDRGEPLLFKGDDFTHTDVTSALG